ncbi:hypothetical protein [Nonomuraea endophytica]|uniref:hypothetical protein n=1 Tax=Nonomuraea endophytica TaxID=714136 RepID=UPI0037CC7A67
MEILVLRHQITVHERQLGADARVRFAPEDRAFLAALLTSLPREVLRRIWLLVRPDTVLRWHRDLKLTLTARLALQMRQDANVRLDPDDLSDRLRQARIDLYCARRHQRRMSCNNAMAYVEMLSIRSNAVERVLRRK